MPKTYKISEEQVKEIEEILKQCKDVKIYKRLKALEMRAKGKKNQEIAQATGFHPKYITILMMKFMKQGLDAIKQDGRSGNNRKMTFEKETEFLKSFMQTAIKGQIITVKEIRKEYDKITEEESSVTTIYRLLHRHGWRKVMPRSKHPKKASDEAIEASKKLSLNTRS